MKYQTDLLCVQPDTLHEIRAWCHTQFVPEYYHIHDKGEFLLCPVFQIEFSHAHDLMQFELTWDYLF